MMSRLCLALARFCSAAWVGAAVLFVVAGIREVRSAQLDSTAKDLLVLIRFPCYYAAGFTLVTAALLATLIAFAGGNRTRSTKFAAGLLLAALVGMWADHMWIYTPLENHIQKRIPRNAAFESLHEASKYVNLATVGATAVAAGVLCFSSQETRVKRQEPEGEHSGS